MSWLFRNWHLKLGAIALAMVLYTGLVYSEAFTEDTFPGASVTVLNQPADSYLLTQQLGDVDVRYRQESGTERVAASSFAVTVDLSTYDLNRPGEAQALDVSVSSLQPGIQILSWDPTTVPVRLDTLGTRDDIPVVVDRGTIPSGLQISTPQVSNRTVTGSGPQSQLVRVDRALARVVIQPSGLNIRAQVDLLPVGVDGQRINSVELTPASVIVMIDVSTTETSKTVPVRPTVAGIPATGYEVGTVTVSPSEVTIRGAPDVLADIDAIATQAVSVAGATQRVTAAPELDLPPGVSLATGEDSSPSVSIQVTSPIVSRTFLLGLFCQGAQAGNSCLPQVTQVALTLRGTAAALASLDASSLTPFVNVNGLAPGTYDVPVNVPPTPVGVDLISVSPATARVVIVAPATPTPAPTPGP